MVSRSEYNFQERPDGGPFLIVHKPRTINGLLAVEVYFTDVPKAERQQGFACARMLQITEDEVRIFPLSVRQGTPYYLKPDYEPIVQLVVEMPVGELPTNQEEVVDLLERLPSGFTKDFRFGLGIPYEYRYVHELIREMPGIHTIRFARYFGDEGEPQQGEFLLRQMDYDTMRRKLDRITVHHQKHARDEKTEYLSKALFEDVDPADYIPKPPVFRKDQLARLTQDGSVSPETLTKRDRKAVLKTVTASMPKMVKEQPSDMLKLSAEIELVTLRQLITKFQEMLDASRAEPSWQKLFKQNAFILSLVFATSTVQVEEDVYVGGQKLSRDGGKLADFLYQSCATGNLSIIEIKRPDTELLSDKAYRGDVFAPHKELTAAVTQVLDQRFQLHRSIDSLKANSERYDIQANAIQCAVIAGITPKTVATKRSFDLYRHSLSNVTVVTYNELLDRLKEVERALSQDASLEGLDDDLGLGGSLIGSE